MAARWPRYSPAWRSLEPTVGQTAEVLEASVQQVCPDAQLVEWASMPEGEYRAFTVGSLFGRDRLECAPGRTHTGYSHNL